MERIQRAVVSSLCYDIYWQGDFGSGENYRRAEPLPFVLVLRGEKFYMRIMPVGVLPNGQPFEARRVGLDRLDRTIVASNSAYEWERVFADGPWIQGRLMIPRDCTPHYASSTPQKERMLATVLSTMERTLSRFRQREPMKYPRTLDLVIADFNVEYPMTYVLVDSEHAVYTIALHNAQDFDSDAYEREGIYPVGYRVIGPHTKELIEKIRKHGIRRAIVLSP